MKYQLELACDGCKKIVNSTSIIDEKQEADKVYKLALFNPLLGWCCGRKPFPAMFEIDDSGVRTFIRGSHPENHTKEPTDA